MGEGVPDISAHFGRHALAREKQARAEDPVFIRKDFLRKLLDWNVNIKECN